MDRKAMLAVQRYKDVCVLDVPIAHLELKWELDTQKVGARVISTTAGKSNRYSGIFGEWRLKVPRKKKILSFGD